MSARLFLLSAQLVSISFLLYSSSCPYLSSSPSFYLFFLGMLSMLVQLRVDPRQNVDFVEIRTNLQDGRLSSYAEVSLCSLLQESGNQMHCSLVSCFTYNARMSMVCCPWYERGPADSRPRVSLEYAAIRNVEQCNWFILQLASFIMRCRCFYYYN